MQMTAPPQAYDYLLGNTDEEHERLIRQAARLEPVTEAFLREAGIAAGQRVLDVGSGVGDVAMLLARVVGNTGAVVGVERDAKSIARARSRVARAGLRNITFWEGDITECQPDGVFDAVVGRYVLQFLADPVAVLRRLSQSLRPGGIAAFLECSFAPFLALSAHLPLWSTAVRLMHQVAINHGVRVEMGAELFGAFTAAGLPAPYMRLYMELGHDPSVTRWLADGLRSAWPHFRRLQISADPLGELDTLHDRLQREVSSARTVVPWLAMIGAYSQRSS
jgi:ubiquinone/menaquinone biosynthesis C-methylase UbiE